MNGNFWKLKESKDQMRAMLLEGFSSFWHRDTGVLREELANIDRAKNSPHAVIISGLRRAGKSTLLAQMAHRLGEDAFYYLNFEDDRLINFRAKDFNDLYQVLVELFGERKIFFIDEIQNISGWEHFVRRFMDMGFKFYITGSNASLLSKELGTRLTGRYIPIELFPFSFKEFLKFRGEKSPKPREMVTVDKARLEKNLSEYLQLGGIPDSLKYPDLPILRTLYNDVIYRDIATRYGLNNISVLKELASYLMSNTANLFSYNKLKKQFGLGSVTTIKNYIDYMENSWLLFRMNVYDYSLKRQQIAPKKIYSIDTGMSNTIGFSFSPNRGKNLENLIFLALRRKNREIYYLTSPKGYEIDFYLPEKETIIQVAENMATPRTKARELRAIEDILTDKNIQKAFILSDANQNPIEINGVSVEILSTAEWLLER